MEQNAKGPEGAGGKTATDGTRRHGSGLLHGLAGVYAFWIAPLIAVLSVCGAYFFSTDSEILSKINSVMTGRLRYGQIGIEKYGIRPWGTYVETHGAGGTTEKVQNYFFIDNSYVMIMVKMGFMVLFAVLLMLILVFLAEWKKRNAMHILILTIVLLTCIMEQHLLEIWYDPFLLLAGEACEVLFGEGRGCPQAIS